MIPYLRRLTLRARLALFAGVAVAVAVAIAAAAAWLVTRQQLTNQLDTSLKSVQASPGYVQALLRICGLTQRPDMTTADTPTSYTVQVVTADGTVCAAPGTTPINVDGSDRAVASGQLGSVLHDATDKDGTPMRVATSGTSLPGGFGDGYAVSIAQPLSVVNKPLGTLALVLFGVAGVGVAGAMTTGLAIARAGLRPVERLTQTVEHIARTEDLGVRIPVAGTDEIARLSSSFNAMTEALSASRDRQQQLIEDAGHELRTPLTSLRTNIELLIRSEKSGRQLPANARQELLGSVEAQISELTNLVGDLQELSRPDSAPAVGSLRVVALHEITKRALDRVELRGPNLTFHSDLRPWYAHADPAALERSLVNVLDNAVKFSPPEGEISVRLASGTLIVRDHGPGIPTNELPYVFDRFWRSPTARSLPGSGLGLAIVAHTIRQAGGSVELRSHPEGGIEAVVRLPGTETPPPALPAEQLPADGD
ncbi:HAMP domain-containing sensor histidine kinase [Streptomyces decoyicus]|uniref:sensor histidine kinase n=1 Tax=Streptomyces decoyicus TaxID=249567 RepID=UPI0033E66985